MTKTKLKQHLKELRKYLTGAVDTLNEIDSEINDPVDYSDSLMELAYDLYDDAYQLALHANSLAVELEDEDR